VRGYVAVIGLMGLAAVLLPAHPGQGGLRLGAALFILSDLMLAVQLFVEQDQRIRRRAGAGALARLLGRAGADRLGRDPFWGVGPG
jgi:uncharacterized membrane protein YhhN